MDEKCKVLIVDDEESSRELIRLSIDWEFLNFEIIGEASNGEEALEIIEHNPPDLVLTDIYMPYMDGLEFSERILRVYPDMKIIVITGHDNFEYAQRGIKAGVFDFIVKPIDEDEIENTIKNAYMTIQKEREIKTNYGWLKEQLNKELPYLKEKFLSDLLHSRMEDVDFARRLEFTKLKIVSSFFQVTMIEIEENDTKEMAMEHQSGYLAYMFVDNIRALLEQMAGIEVFIDNRNNIIILNTCKESLYEVNKQIELIHRRLLGHSNMSVMVGIGSWYEGFNNIKTSYKEALEAISYKIVSGINQIITYEDLTISKPNIEMVDEAWEDKLSLYIKSGVVSESLAILEQGFIKIMSQENIQIKDIRMKAIRIFMLISKALTEIGINSEDKKTYGEGVFEEIFQANSLPRIKAIVSAFAELVCNSVVLEQTKKQNSIMDKINHYIDENIQEPLSLNSISERYHLNKSYLSRIYKERTGMTLGDSILSRRMEKSIQLIKSTDKKAYEIAEEVGYVDPNYFGSSFKKYTGKSISEFRKLYGKETKESKEHG